MESPTFNLREAGFLVEWLGETAYVFDQSTLAVALQHYLADPKYTAQAELWGVDPDGLVSRLRGLTNDQQQWLRDFAWRVHRELGRRYAPVGEVPRETARFVRVVRAAGFPLEGEST